MDVPAVRVGVMTAGTALALRLRRWTQSVLDELRVSGVVLALFLVVFVAPRVLIDALTDR
jgi:hypothetical protein